MIKPTILILSLFCAVMAHAQANYSLLTSTDIEFSQLKKGFLSPPDESKLRCYWWWLNSMATKESITRDLEEMKAKGYGGASLVDAGSSSYNVAAKTAAGPVYMSEQWMELYRHAVREADRLGIELSVNLGSGWNPGGPSITPEMAMKKLVWSEVNVAGGQLVSMELPQPEMKFIYRDILVQAIPHIPGALVQNEGIQNWKKKSFNEKIGWKGIYPLHELRQDFEGSGEEQAISRAEIIDLTAHYQNGKLEWKAPAGQWTIIRYGYTCTGARTSTNSDGWEGLSVDHLNPEAFELFSSKVIMPLITEAQKAGSSVKFLQTDSWEMDNVSWTDRFQQEFKKFRNYELAPFMPVLAGRIVENRDLTNRFLHDFRKTIGDCVMEYHYKLFAALAHQHGMGIHPESGGPHSAPVDALQVMGLGDFPQGEFWAMANTHRIKDDERLSVRQSACAAHTNGKRFVAAEGPTSIGPQWERSPKDLKGNIDRVFCSGVNRIVWHTFTSSPKEYGLPGNEYFAGTHLNPNVTWWKQSVDFISYLNRSSYLLQQGLFVADVLYYYGDDVPNFVFLKEDLAELNMGHDWDKCSKDVILNRLSFDGEKIVLPDGMNYRVLMLSPEKAIDLQVLRKIESLVSQGMTVIGNRPDQTSGLTGYSESDFELKEITARLWGQSTNRISGENKVGKGRVTWGRNINEVLAEMDVAPDFSFKSNDGNTALDYIHRTTATEDIYFVANRYGYKGIDDFTYRYQTTLPDRYEQADCVFRVTGKVPELWNPKTGQTTRVLTWREEDGKTILPLHLDPDGSVFVIFRKAEPERHITRITKDGKTVFPDNDLATAQWPCVSVQRMQEKDESSAVVAAPGNYILEWSDGKQQVLKAQKAGGIKPLDGAWELQFDHQWGVAEKIEVRELESWTKFTNPGIKYYSGTATYRQSFKLKGKDFKTKELILDLGNVQEMASVKLNGHQLQVMWSAPFIFDISSYVKAGKNDLEVEVVNMWPNRLIGDANLPVDKRRTKTNINKFNGPDRETYLRESGLLGPVKILINERFELKQ